MPAEFYSAPGPCECKTTKDLEKVTSFLKGLQPLHARQCGQPQILKFQSILANSDACYDAGKVCEVPEFKFFVGTSDLQITSFPHIGLAWNRSTLELTLDPQSNDPIGQHSVLLSMNLPDDDVHTVEIKYFIEEKEEYGNHETSQLRRLAPNAPGYIMIFAVTDGFSILYDYSTQGTNSVIVYILKPNSLEWQLLRDEDRLLVYEQYRPTYRVQIDFVKNTLSYQKGDSISAGVKFKNAAGEESPLTKNNIQFIFGTPNKPQIKTDAFVDDKVKFTWDAPDQTSYNPAQSFIFSILNCVTYSATVYSGCNPNEPMCEVPISELRTTYKCKNGDEPKVTLKAVNQYGTSEESEIYFGTRLPVLLLKPLRPKITSNVIETVGSEGKFLSLGYQVTQAAEEPPIQGFKVFVKTKDPNNLDQFIKTSHCPSSASPTDPFCKISMHAFIHEYKYQIGENIEVYIISFNQNGDSEPSDPITVGPQVQQTIPKPPAAPVVRFGVPPDDQLIIELVYHIQNGGSLVSKFDVIIRPPEDIQTVQASQSQFRYTIGMLLDKGFKQGQTIDVSLVATNIEGSSKESEKSNIVIPRTKPQKPYLDVRLNNTIWIIPSGKDGGYPITGHKILGWSKTLNDFKLMESPNLSVESPNLSDPYSNWVYKYPTEKYLEDFGFSIGESTRFKVSAFNSIGESDISDESFEIRLVLPPGTPAAPTLKIEDADLVLEWTAPESDGGSEITFYNLYNKEIPLGNSKGPMCTTPTSCRFPIMLLVSIPFFKRGDFLQFAVEAVNSGTNSKRSPDSNSIILPCITPNAPAVAIATIYNRTIEMTLHEGTQDAKNCPFSFQVYGWSKILNAFKIISGYCDKISLIVMQPSKCNVPLTHYRMEFGYNYEEETRFKVKVFNKDHTSDFSPESDPLILTKQFPDVPQFPQIYLNNTSSSLGFQWKAPVDDGGEAIEKYLQRFVAGNDAEEQSLQDCQQQERPPWFFCEIPITTLNQRGYQNGTQIKFLVKAANKKGVSLTGESALFLIPYLNDTCTETKIIPFQVKDMSITAFLDQSTQKIDYKLDTVAATTSNSSYCGVPKYTLQVPMKSDQKFIRVQDSQIYLGSNKTNFSDVGVWEVIIKANLTKYPSAIFETKFQVTIQHPCFQTSFPKLFLDNMSYKIGDPRTTQEFNLPSDTVSQNLTSSYLCGVPEVKTKVLDLESQTFVSLTLVQDDQYKISVQTDDPELAKEQPHQGYVQVSLPKYGIIQQFPFNIIITQAAKAYEPPQKITKPNEPPYFLAFKDQTSLPEIQLQKGVKLPLPMIIDDDQIDQVKIRLDVIFPASMKEKVTYEFSKSDKAYALIVDVEKVEVQLITLQITLTDAAGQNSRPYELKINVEKSQEKEEIAEEDKVVEIIKEEETKEIKNNTDTEREVIQVGNETFVKFEMKDGTFELVPIPPEEPVKMTDKVFEEESTFQPTFKKITIPQSVSIADFKSMRQKTVVTSDGQEVVYDLCIPSVTQISRKGSLEILFNREIIELTDIDKWNIKESNVIQFQIIPASKTTKAKENASQLNFDWRISDQTPKGFKIQITFDNPKIISSSSSDSDELRVVLVNASRFIKCKPTQTATEGSERLLRPSKGSGSSVKSASGQQTKEQSEGSENSTETETEGPVVSSQKPGKKIGGFGSSGIGTVGAPGQEFNPDKIPDDSELLNPMPPQSPADETIPEEEAANNIGYAFNTAVTICFALSILIGFSLADVWGSVNSLQMIALIPFNKVTFTSELYFAFDALNQFTGFDYLNPWQIDDNVQEWTGESINHWFGFTETDKYSHEFAWMGLDQANFVYNTGSVSFILVAMVIRTLVIPVVRQLLQRGWKGPGRILRKMDMNYDDVIGMWVRMWHEQFLTFIQCGIVTSLMLNLQIFTVADQAAFSFGLILVLPITILYPVFLIWFSFYHVRRLVLIHQRDLYLQFSEHIPVWIREKDEENLKKIEEYLKEKPDLEKKYKEKLEQEHREFKKLNTDLLTNLGQELIKSSSEDSSRNSEMKQSQLIQSSKTESSSSKTESSKSRDFISATFVKNGELVSQLQEIPQEMMQQGKQKSQTSFELELSYQDAPKLIYPSSSRIETEEIKEDQASARDQLLHNRARTHSRSQSSSSMSAYVKQVVIETEGVADDHFSSKNESPSEFPPEQASQSIYSGELRIMNHKEYFQRKDSSAIALGLLQKKLVKIMYDEKQEKVVLKKDYYGHTKEQEEEYLRVIETRYGGLYENLNMYSMAAQYANVVFIVRRIILLYIMFQRGLGSWFQVMCFMILSMINLVYIGYTMPFAERRQNVVEIIDEGTILAISVLQMALESGMIDDMNVKTGLGYTIIVLIMVNCCFSMYFVVKDMILEFIEVIREKFQMIKEKCSKKEPEPVGKEKIKGVKFFDFRAKRYRREGQEGFTSSQSSSSSSQKSKTDSKMLKDSLCQLSDQIEDREFSQSIVNEQRMIDSSRISKSCEFSSSSEGVTPQRAAQEDRDANQPIFTLIQTLNEVETERNGSFFAHVSQKEGDFTLPEIKVEQQPELIVQKEFTLPEIMSQSKVEQQPEMMSQGISFWQKLSFVADVNDESRVEILPNKPEIDQILPARSIEEAKQESQIVREENRVAFDFQEGQHDAEEEHSDSAKEGQPDAEAQIVPSRTEQHRNAVRSILRSIKETAISKGKANEIILEVQTEPMFESELSDVRLQDLESQSSQGNRDQNDKV